MKEMKKRQLRFILHENREG